MANPRTHCKHGHDLSESRRRRGKSNNTYCYRCAQDRGKVYQRLKQYGITQAQYLALLESQKYACAICHSSRWDNKCNTPHVDHCHETGKVRGLLCNDCNLGLGRFKDSRSLLAKAMSYLNKHE